MWLGLGFALAGRALRRLLRLQRLTGGEVVVKAWAEPWRPRLARDASGRIIVE